MLHRKDRDARIPQRFCCSFCRDDTEAPLPKNAGKGDDASLLSDGDEGVFLHVLRVAKLQYKGFFATIQLIVFHETQTKEKQGTSTPCPFQEEVYLGY